MVAYFTPDNASWTPVVLASDGSEVSLPDFDPSTAYAGDYQFFPFLENVTWERRTEAGVDRFDGLKGRWDAPQQPDVQAVGGGIGLSKEGPVYVTLWQIRAADREYDDQSLTLTLDPKPGDVLIREDASVDAGHASRWLVLDVTRRPFKGQWELLCDREVENAA